MLDTTITCPFAERYEGKRSVEDGELRKRKEYPRAAGLHVTGVAVDVFGRLGPALDELLMRWADCARQRDADVGQQPRQWVGAGGCALLWRLRVVWQSSYTALTMPLVLCVNMRLQFFTARSTRLQMLGSSCRAELARRPYN